VLVSISSFNKTIRIAIAQLGTVFGYSLFQSIHGNFSQTMSSSGAEATKTGAKPSSDKPRTSGIAAGQAIGGILFAWIAGGTVAWALNIQTVSLLSFAVQYAVFFLQAMPQKSEFYYDFTGGLTNFACIVVSYLFMLPAEHRGLRNHISTALGSLWAIRLGSFLYSRIQRDGRDVRFDQIKLEPVTFAMAWSLQGLWIELTTLPITVLNSHPLAHSLSDTPVSLVECIGWTLFIVGFAIEAIADQQKTEFNKNPANKGKFITVGLWAWSRHPNYFGELTLWTGLALSTSSIFPINSPAKYLTWLGPAFVYMLLTKMSGIPMLEKKANKKWGKDEAYIEYKKNTPVLMLRPPRKSRGEKKLE
jgi:steroid 5-alpha reductase family enzyme